MKVKNTIEIFDDYGKKILKTDKVKIIMKSGEICIGYCFDIEVMYCSFSLVNFNNVTIKIYYHDIDSMLIV